uniref:Uncharacterized protein n=1 Tax=Mus musculus TaxID=10090 RepID=Q3U5B0_MOUSE|nr:unnamed protein product [Mus musculus]
MFQASRLADGVVNSRMLHQKKGVNSLSQPSCAVNNGPRGNREQNRSALQNGVWRCPVALEWPVPDGTPELLISTLTLRMLEASRTLQVCQGLTLVTNSFWNQNNQSCLGTLPSDIATLLSSSSGMCECNGDGCAYLPGPVRLQGLHATL